jgi:adenylate cyclase
MPIAPNVSKPRQTIGFRTAILQLVLGALLFSVGTIAIVGYINSERTLEEIRQKHFGLVSLALSREVSRILEPAERILPELKNFTDRGLINPLDPDPLGIFLAERLRQEESVGWLSFTNSATGAFTGAWRNSEGGIGVNHSDPNLDNGRPKEFLLNLDGSHSFLPARNASSYDARTRPWYQKAVAAGGWIVWTRPYNFNEGTTGISACMAIYEQGRSIGVFTADFTTGDINEFLNRVIQERKLLLFVDTLSGDPLGVASEMSLPSEALLQQSRKLYSLDQGELETGRVSFRSFRLGSENYVSVVTPFTLPSGLTFLTGVVGPESDFLGSAQSNLALTAIIGLIALTAGSLFAIWLSHQLATPLTKLSHDLEQVGRFELTNLPPPKSAVREIAIVGDSFDRMKAGLRSFVKYVPRDVVRELILQKQDAARGGSLRRLTLFFSDVAGFTRISENLGPTEVFAELGDYFDLVTDIVVEKFGGTLDKFVGDGIVAFFNAPAPVELHAAVACEAAVEVVHRLSDLEATRRATDRPIFRTRIGLHTGEVLVGNIGTQRRLSYSAIGDAVNLASRLEGLNKLYGTLILASDQTRNEAGDRFEWRYIDRVAVLGRSQSTDIFELLGERGTVSSSKLELRDEYEAGLRKYFDGDFRDAVLHFTGVLAHEPQDGASQVLLARCNELALRPAPSLWSGIYEMLEK